MSPLDLLQSTLQQNVAEGNLTEEEVAELMKKMRISGAASVRSIILHIANLRDPACMKGKKVPSLLCIALRASSHIFQYGGTKACTVPISCQLTLSCAPTDKQMVRPFFMSANQ